MNKELLRAAILSKLEADLNLLASAAALARDEAISEESRAESKYDTHSQEAAYLAEGQAKLAKEVAENASVYRSLELPEFGPGDPIGAGALVQLGADWYFMGPRAGGLEFEAEGRKILVVTGQSPLGAALLGRRAGERVKVGRTEQLIGKVL